MTDAAAQPNIPPDSAPPPMPAPGASPKGRRKKAEVQPPTAHPNQLDAFPVGAAGLSPAANQDGKPADPANVKVWLADLATQTVRAARGNLPIAAQILSLAIFDPGAVAPHQVTAAEAILRAARLDLVTLAELGQVPARSVVEAFAGADDEG